MKQQSGYTVSRQIQYYNAGAPVVEVAQGGIDYMNPDALSRKYQGELKTYADPREATTTAIAICKAWRQHGETRAKVAHGATGGMTMPFEPCTFGELLQWADTAYAQLPKCVQCGDLLGGERYGNCEMGDFDCCSEHCAEIFYALVEEETDPVEA